MTRIPATLRARLSALPAVLTLIAPALWAAGPALATDHAGVAGSAAGNGTARCPAWLDHDFTRLHSNEHANLCQLAAGKPLLIVNTASHCGFTPQFKGLEALHEQYAARGLVVVGFSSDDFHQEDADESVAANICYVNYGVKFTMFAPTPVRGEAANPVFRELARQTAAPAWNFNKYLVKPDGTVTARFDSPTGPDSEALRKAIDGLLPTLPAVSK